MPRIGYFLGFFLNNVPSKRNIFPSGLNVAYSESDSELAAQFRVRQKDFSSLVHRIHEFFVEGVDLVVTSNVGAESED